MRTLKEGQVSQKRKSLSGSLKDLEYDDKLFEILSDIRKSIAEEKAYRVTPYFIIQPFMKWLLFINDPEAFLEVGGVGSKKI